MGNPQRYSKEFQERAVRRMKLGENVSQLARESSVRTRRGERKRFGY